MENRPIFPIFRRRPIAFTLIEVIIVVAILSVIGVGFSRYLADSVDIYLKAAEEGELYGETWVAAERIAMELRQAAVLEGRSGEPVTAPGRGQTGPTLTFTRPSAAAAKCPSCVDNSTTVTFTFTPGDNKLWRDTASAPYKLLADNVLSFTVTASDDPVSQRYFTIAITRSADSVDDTSATVTMTTVIYPSAARNETWTQVIR